MATRLGETPMSTWKLLLQEVRYRKTNFVLSVLVVAVCAAALLAGPTLVDAYGRQTRDALTADADQTRKIMLKMGFNLLVVHRDTDMTDFWSDSFTAAPMPQQYIHRLAESPDLTLVRHLVARLTRRIEWNGRRVLLVGELPEVTQTHFGAKKPLGFLVEPGTVHVGAELHGDLKVGDEVDILGRKLRVAKLLPPQGSRDDVTLAVHLGDAQQILQMPGVISEILAIGCQCRAEQLGVIRQQLAGVLPDTRITVEHGKFVARAEQRALQQQRLESFEHQWQNVLLFTTPLVVLVCGVLVGLFTLANVRQRGTEIGLLRALGKSSWRIAGLFLGKAALVGLLGGLLGAAAGVALVQQAGPLLDLQTAYLQADRGLLAAILLGGPLVAALAAYLPTLLAVAQDPAVVLRDH